MASHRTSTSHCVRFRFIAPVPPNNPLEYRKSPQFQYTGNLSNNTLIFPILAVPLEYQSQNFSSKVNRITKLGWPLVVTEAKQILFRRGFTTFQLPKDRSRIQSPLFSSDGVLRHGFSVLATPMLLADKRILVTRFNPCELSIQRRISF